MKGCMNALIKTLKNKRAIAMGVNSDTPLLQKYNPPDLSESEKQALSEKFPDIISLIWASHRDLALNSNFSSGIHLDLPKFPLLNGSFSK